jgi:uncharacterized protein DUF6318
VNVKLRTVVALVFVLGVLATAGCGGGGTPGAQAQQAAAPVLPDAAKKKTPKGGAAFTKYFFASINHAFASGRTDHLVRLSAPTCEMCRGTIGDVSYAFARGRIRGGEVSVEKIGSPTDVGEFTNRLVTYSEAKYEEIDRDGKVAYAVAAKNGYQLVVKLAWSGTGWQVAQLTRHGKPTK